MNDLVGRCYIVTGAAAGIGRATALAIAQAGGQVVCADIDEEGAAETVSAIADKGGEAASCRADVSDNVSVEAMVAFALERFGRLDGAHNNAGIALPVVPLFQTEEADWDRCLSVNLKGTWLCMRAELRHMLANGGGSIVNTSSLGGILALPGGAPYCASKHGVIGLTRTAAIEYATAGVRVNAVCPGIIRTAITERFMESDPEMTAAMLPPMKRVGEPNEIADAVVFLLSDRSSYLTGQAIAIDGGTTAI